MLRVRPKRRTRCEGRSGEAIGRRIIRRSDYRVGLSCPPLPKGDDVPLFVIVVQVPPILQLKSAFSPPDIAALPRPVSARWTNRQLE
jgi:hypothetical protein